MQPQVNEWTVLEKDTVDPYFSSDRHYCRDGHDGWFCTRSPGHQGIHVACIWGAVICDVWQPKFTLDQQLPEGF